jgi:hypothetical protein
MQAKILAHGSYEIEWFPQDTRESVAVLFCREDQTKMPEYLGLFDERNQRPVFFDVCQGQLPSSTNFSSIYITSSPMGIYDQKIADLKKYIKSAVDASGARRIIGDCFGAQALASWILNLRVTFSFNPENNVYRNIIINGRTYLGHFNHSYFIENGLIPNGTALATSSHVLVDHQAKTRRVKCIDAFVANIGAIRVLGLMPHPNVQGPDGKQSNLITLIRAFHDSKRCLEIFGKLQ